MSVYAYESDFQAEVVDILRLGGFWVDHNPDSRRNLEGGAFDLVAIKPPRFILIEVKRGGGRVSPKQRNMDEMLTACGIEHYIVWPKDLELVYAIANVGMVEGTLDLLPTKARVIEGNPYGMPNAN